jgi:hypothetical protein
MKSVVASLVAICASCHASALSLSVERTPSDGFVRVGQEVRLALTLTNDAQDRPGLTIISTNDIDGLSFPFEIAPCQLGVAQLNPPTSPISYILKWDLIDLAPNETRRCESRFFVRSIPNGAIPIRFARLGTPLAQTEFRGVPVTTIPSLSSFGIFVLIGSIVFIFTRRSAQ